MAVSAIKPMALALDQTTLSTAILALAPQNRVVSHASGNSRTVWGDSGSSCFQSNSFDYILNSIARFDLGHKPSPPAWIVLTLKYKTGPAEKKYLNILKIK